MRKELLRAGRHRVLHLRVPRLGSTPEIEPSEPGLHRGRDVIMEAAQCVSVTSDGLQRTDLLHDGRQLCLLPPVGEEHPHLLHGVEARLPRPHRVGELLHR
eukprot:1585506-Pyramimonas_sp.AAC.2